jgi:flagellar export protein FliJ
MSKLESDGEQRWETVERWKKLEVEEAQTQHAARRVELEQARARVDDVLERISEAQAFAREQSLAGQALSAEMLQRAIRYAASLERDLQDARESLDTAQTRLEEARLVLSDKLTQLSVMRRLRERRATQMKLETTRREQRRVDDAALLKLTTDNHGKASGETSWQ